MILAAISHLREFVRKKGKNCVEPKIDVGFFGFFFAGELLGSHL